MPSDHEKFEAEQLRRKHTLEGALSMASDSMTFRDEENKEKWEKMVSENTDRLNQDVYRCAEIWARLMECRIRVGDTLEACADTTFSIMDNGHLSGFAANAITATLVEVWIHGERLRRWHNLKYGIRGQGEKANEEGGILASYAVCVRT